MCYDVQTKLETLLKRAIRFNDSEGIRRIKEELGPYLTNHFHTTGFAHQQLLIYQNDKPNQPSPAHWGLVPHWVKTQKQKLDLWNKTINARGESIFEKPSFKDSATNKRCILYVDGFFEYHYYRGKAYPCFIFRTDNEPMAIGGLWSENLDKESGEIFKSFTLVTTKANEFMAKIHNNPKLKEARMPLILNKEEEEEWLSNNKKEKIKALIKPSFAPELSFHTVQKLRGKNVLGNVPQVSDEYVYQELIDAF